MVRLPTLSLTFLPMATIMMTVGAQQQQCTLNCPVDAPCTFGSNPTLNASTAAAWGETTTIQGMHCACPPGWTGVKCDHIFESCGGQGHVCYHGGECIPGLQDQYGNTQLFCDCSNAVSSDGLTKYVGKYCETPSVDLCPDKINFCVHGGGCNPNYP